MKFVQIIAFCVLIASTVAFADYEAERCVADKCKLADGCICSSTSSPLPLKDTPQFVTITVDDSVSADSYALYYKPLLFGRKNADGSPISATFYVPHAYTDYEVVSNLFSAGFEIAVNSISKGTADYFANASLEQLIDEFDGQRKIISIYANIPIEYITGARTPHFQLRGNLTFQAYEKAGLKYDNSWIALSQRNFYPYTLHYLSSQPAVIGETPNESFPNLSVIPVNNFVGKQGKECNVLHSCELNGTAADITEWLIQKYNEKKSSTKAPINLLVNTAWFQLEKSSFEGIQQFLNYLETQKDTFVVSHSELLNWAKNPKPLGEYKPVVNHPKELCIVPMTCQLEFEEEIRWMRSCVPCPNVYPWLKNPEGN